MKLNSLKQLSLAFTIVPTMVSNQIMADINEYRLEKGLEPVFISEQTCAVATIRLEEVKYNFSHDGFRSRLNMYQGHQKATENLAKGFTEETIVQKWIESPTHEKNLVADTPEVCVVKGQDESGEDFYVMEGLKKNKYTFGQNCLFTIQRIGDILYSVLQKWGIK